MALVDVHVAIQANDFGEIDIPLDAYLQFNITGRTRDSIAMGTGNDELGVYSDGFGYQTSSSYTGTRDERMLVAIGQGQEQPRQFFLVGGADLPAKGTKLINPVLYKEHANDDGKSVQTAVTWYKYRFQYDDGGA